MTSTSPWPATVWYAARRSNTSAMVYWISGTSSPGCVFGYGYLQSFFTSARPAGSLPTPRIAWPRSSKAPGCPPGRGGTGTLPDRGRRRQEGGAVGEAESGRVWATEDIGVVIGGIVAAMVQPSGRP